jgi:hypothetical protein
MTPLHWPRSVRFALCALGALLIVVLAARAVGAAKWTQGVTTAEQWKPFSSQQTVVTRQPGFLWNAQVAMFPGLPAWVEDSYIAGQGRLLVKVLGWFTVADSQGGGEIARGEFMRYFAESPWYPTALLPSQVGAGQWAQLHLFAMTAIFLLLFAVPWAQECLNRCSECLATPFWKHFQGLR